MALFTLFLKHIKEQRINQADSSVITVRENKTMRSNTSCTPCEGLFDY